MGGALDAPVASFSGFGDVNTRRQGGTVVAAEDWRVEVLIEDDEEARERYGRALSAASRVVTYWHDEWEPAITQTRRVAREGSSSTSTRTAIDLCADPHAGIMIAGTLFPGGELTDDGLGVVGATEPGRVHTTHEASVVSAWLRGECGTSEVRMGELFRSTIALSWPVGQSEDDKNERDKLLRECDRRARREAR